MKVLHICTRDSGGAGRGAINVHRGLKALGVDSKLLVLERLTKDEDVVPFTQKFNIIHRLLNRVRSNAVRSELAVYQKARFRKSDLFSDNRSIYAVGVHPLVREANIIVLHWIPHMVDVQEFFSRIEGRSIVWTLHDMNAFTGGCHYAEDCMRYKTGCGCCPQLGSIDPNDLSRQIFKRKEASYRKCRIYIAAGSEWLAERARGSLLFKGCDIRTIHYSVDTSIFVKKDKYSSRELVGLPKDETIILFGADYFPGRKGLKYLIEALRLLRNKTKITKIALAIFGKIDPANISKITDIPVYMLGKVNDDKLLSLYYNACDIFTIPSLEEVFGQVCLESMACGTPAVGFDVGGIPEMIIPGKTGLLASKKDSESLAKQLAWMIDNPRERETMAENGIRLVDQEYTIEVQAKRYLKLFEKVLQ
ncbi:MAG: glycosyltransferase [Candidatus Omnitrophica bacterium]|nr:glycosyltransferase [Candidatus Omnitrophota bacterium]